MEIPRNWTFEDQGVASAFDRHVREQLPWYDLATGAVAHIVRHYLPRGGTVYDLGASTGNVGRAIAGTLQDRQATLIPIEASPEMCGLYDGPGRDNLVCRDVTQYDFGDSTGDVAVCFLILMFLPYAERRRLLDRLHKAIRPGGVIIVFDKVEAGASYPATVLWRLTLAGKVAAGVPADEIIQKELSLIGVQRPIDPLIVERRPGAVKWFQFGEFAGWLLEVR